MVCYNRVIDILLRSGKIPFNTYKRVRFDEVMNVLEYSKSNSEQLITYLGCTHPEKPYEALNLLTHSLEAQDSSFPSIYDINVQLTCEYDSFLMGLEFCMDIAGIMFTYIMCILEDPDPVLNAERRNL